MLARAEQQLQDGEAVSVADVAPAVGLREANFKAWFGESKVVDAEGAPLVVYHGTNQDIASFDPGAIGASMDSGKLGQGFYFSSNPRLASGYANSARPRAAGDAPNVLPVHLSLKSPVEFDTKGGNIWDKLRTKSAEWGITDDPVRGDGNAPNPEWSAKFTAAARERGYDGVTLEYSDGVKEIAVFTPDQIKSAIGNSGRFDPTSPSLTDSTFATWADQITAAVREMQGPGMLADAAPAIEAAPPRGNPRDLQTEMISLRKQDAVLNKLLECLNG